MRRKCRTNAFMKVNRQQKLHKCLFALRATFLVVYSSFGNRNANSIAVLATANTPSSYTAAFLNTNILHRKDAQPACFNLAMPSSPECQSGRPRRSFRGQLLSLQSQATSASSEAASSAAISSATGTKIQNHAAVSLQFSEFSTFTVVEDSQGVAAPSPPPVLFLHGLLGNKRNFATIGNSLSNQLETKRRILGLDLRNHGDNHHDWRDSMNYHEMAMDVLAFMDTHGLSQAVLIGHSMGGKVAQALALLEPDRVAGLCILDIAPVAYCPKVDPHWKAVHDIIEALYKATSDDSSVDNTHQDANDDGSKQSILTKRHVDRLLQPSIPDPALRAFCLTNLDPKTGQWKIPMDAISRQLDSLAAFDIDTSRQYSGDAFFIHGGESRFVRHAYMETIAQYFPNHLLTTVRGAGHWVHAEAPDDTIALLKQYLDR